MTDITNVQANAAVIQEYSVKEAAFTVDETYWGYIVRPTQAPQVAVVIGQSVCLFLGASLLAAALGLWVLPETMVGSEPGLMRIGATVVFAGIATLLLWFASRGTQTEIQIDNSLGEVREVVRNKAGQLTLIGRYGFDSIGGVFLDRTAGDDTASLVLRYRNTAQVLPVVTARERDLLTLRDRLGRDLMVAQAGQHAA